MSIKILLVEDEEALQKVIKLNLELESYDVQIVGDGMSAIKLVEGNKFDLIILDVMLPGIDGFSVCQNIRLTDQKTPVLFLTAKDGSQDKVKGLKIGGDDYIVKPFNLEEFLLRVEKLIARSSIDRVDLKRFLFDGNEINFGSYKCINFRGDERKLSEKEVKLLRFLIAKEGLAVSRAEILDNVWGYDVYPTTRTIDNFILGFRKFFEVDPQNPQIFQSVRGVGYTFVRTR